MPPILAGPSPWLQYWGFCACLNGWVRAQVQSTEIPPEGGTQASMGSLSSPGMDAVTLSQTTQSLGEQPALLDTSSPTHLHCYNKGFPSRIVPNKSNGFSSLPPPSIAGVGCVGKETAASRDGGSGY